MQKNKIRRLIIVTLTLILVMGIGASLAYGYWVDQIQGDWQMSFSRPIAIHITGLTPPEPVKLPLEETMGNSEPGAGEEAESPSSPGEQAPAPAAKAEGKPGSGEVTAEAPGEASAPGSDAGSAPQSQTESGGNENAGAAEADGIDE